MPAPVHHHVEHGRQGLICSQGATTIIGGGDSVCAAEKAGVTLRMSHISTGGGASLELIEGRTLPGVAALTPRPTLPVRSACVYSLQRALLVCCESHDLVDMLTWLMTIPASPLPLGSVNKWAWDLHAQTLDEQCGHELRYLGKMGLG